MGAAGSVIPDEINIEAFKELTGGYTTAVFEENKNEAGLLTKDQFKNLVETFLANKAKSKTSRLDIIHFNDVYNLDSQYAEDPIGGAARFMTVVEEIKATLAAQGRKPLILFSGDFVGPSLMSTITQGAHLIDAFNLLKVDYATFGNHEFDYGYASLVNRLAGVDNDVQGDDIPFTDYPETETKWLMTNMTEAATGQPVGGDKYCSKTALIDWPVGDCGESIKVGLLAVSSDWLKGCSQLKKGELLYEDFIQSATNAANDLKASGADIVLALTHSRLAEDRELTAAVPAIDIMFGGHDHFYRRDRKERIVKGGEEWRWVSHVMADVDTSSKKTVDVYTERYDVCADIAEHPDMKALVDKYNHISDLKYARVLCSTEFALDPTESAVRFKESAVANWMCDMVAADYSADEGEQQAEIAFISGFTFSGKQVLPAGDFTLGDLMSIFPRPESIIVVKLSGADILRSLTLGVSNLPRESGAIHHVSNRLAYTVVLPEDRTAHPSVTDVSFDGKPIDVERMYTVSTTATLGKGKYGYSWFQTAERIVDEENGMQIQDLVKMYCEYNYRKAGEHKTAVAPTMNRIQIVNE